MTPVILLEAAMLPAILAYFEGLADPRHHRTRLHPLQSILGIALCGVLCGADSWVEIEEYGLAKKDWLSRWLDLPHGIPSHDTFARLFARLEPATLGGCLQALTRELATKLEKHIALDGKYLRHSFDTALEKGPLVMLNAWASSQRLVLASVAVDTKSNEIKAIPQLLALLDITGCIVTIDAMGTQKAVASQIVAQGGDYVLALKGNQESIHTDVQLFFEHALAHRFEGVPHDCVERTDFGHGRKEIRRCTTVNLCDLEGRWADVQGIWKGLESLVRIDSTRVLKEHTSTETRYYLSTLTGGADQALRSVRSHWGVENSLHYVLDIAFNEDDCRIRKDHAPVNFALLRQVALNLLRQEKTQKNGIKVKRSKAGWDDAYLFKVLDSCSQI
jgi:predicted transposase YbfD/YdcC